MVNIPSVFLLISKANKMLITLCILFSICFWAVILEIIFAKKYGKINFLKNLENGRELIIKKSTNKDLEYELTPLAKGFAWDAYVEINAHGHRGVIGEQGKYKGFRVCVFGDSITFGNLLPVESTFSWQLNEMLNKGKRKCEVLNFGVGGYDIIQDVFMVEEKGLLYEPNLVIIGFSLNDVYIVSHNMEYIHRAKKYKNKFIQNSCLVQQFIKKINEKHLGGWAGLVNDEKEFQKKYKNRILMIKENEQELLALMKKARIEFYRRKSNIGRLRYAFEYLCEMGKEKDFSVLIVIFPWLMVEDEYGYVAEHSIITREAKSKGFDVLDLTNSFVEEGIEKLKIISKDYVHPNEKGHRIAAKQINKHIVNKYLK